MSDRWISFEMWLVLCALLFGAVQAQPGAVTSTTLVGIAEVNKSSSIAYSSTASLSDPDCPEVTQRGLSISSSGGGLTVSGNATVAQSIDAIATFDMNGGRYAYPLQIGIFKPATAVIYTNIICFVSTSCSSTPSIYGPASNFTLIAAPSGMTINSDTGTISFLSSTTRPMQSYVIAFKGSGLSFAYWTTTVTDSGVPAIASSFPSTVLTVGVAVDLSISIVSHQSADATYTISPSLPAGLSWSISGRITGTPTSHQMPVGPSEYTITSSLSGTSKFRLVIMPQPTSAPPLFVVVGYCR